LKQEQFNNLSSDIQDIHNLISNVEYSKEEEAALTSVGMKYVAAAEELRLEIFALTQLLEVHRTYEAMESDTQVH
jgi:hypothetical protein